MKLNQNLFKIETERLFLVPMTYQFASKLLFEDNTAYEEYGVKPAEEYPNKDTFDILPVIKEKLSVLPAPDGFGAWLFIEKQSNYVIGDGGFKGKPDENGGIDLGYGIIESKRRQGYTFEAANALLCWGLSQKSVKAVTADCLKTNTASYQLLKKLGMTEIKRDDKLIYFKIAKE